VQSLGIESQKGYWYEVSFKARGMKTKRAGNIKHQAYGERRSVPKGYTSMLETVEDYNLIGCHE
jgi:hypothetical protein